MIYAAFDVSLQNHAKAIKAGPSMYLWTYAMLWSRDQKESGLVPRHVLLRATWADPDENAVALDRLIAAGLFLDEGESVRIWNYEKKNDVREVIEKKIEDARTRKADYRARKACPKNVPSHVPELSHGTPGVGVGVDDDDGVDVKVIQGVQGEPSPPPAEPKRRAVACPSSGASDSEVAAFCAHWKCDANHTEWVKFLDFHRAKRSLFVDWSAAWRNWVRRSSEFAANRPNGAYRNGKILQQAPANGPLWTPGMVAGDGDF